MLPELPPSEAAWEPKSVLLESQGLAVLRCDNRYVGLECGPQGGGHGHPDRLQLILHADGVYWLPDPGTGSYVAHDLFWYRSTLVHNAPRLDGESQPPGNASCECFDDQGEWAWVRGRFNDLVRMVATGPAYIVDVTMLAGREDHLLELPWHLAGRGAVETAGRWGKDELRDELATRRQRFVPDAPGPVGLSHLQQPAPLPAPLRFDRPPPEVLPRSGWARRRRSTGHSRASICRNRSSWDSRTNIVAAKMPIPVPTTSLRWRTRRGRSRRCTWRWS